MANVPEYNLALLNMTWYFRLSEEEAQKDKMDLLNNMWRNFCINDTYETRLIFKDGLQWQHLGQAWWVLNDSLRIRGAAVISGRRIRCHRTTGP